MYTKINNAIADYLTTTLPDGKRVNAYRGMVSGTISPDEYAHITFDHTIAAEWADIGNLTVNVWVRSIGNKQFWGYADYITDQIRKKIDETAGEIDLGDIFIKIRLGDRIQDLTDPDVNLVRKVINLTTQITY